MGPEVWLCQQCQLVTLAKGRQRVWMAQGLARSERDLGSGKSMLVMKHKVDVEKYQQMAVSDQDQ